MRVNKALISFVLFFGPRAGKEIDVHFWTGGKKYFPTPASLIGPAAKAKAENTPSG